MFHINCPDVLMTQRCTFRCEYCFEDQHSKDIDIDEFVSYVENACFTSFFPFGGEPLLRINMLIKAMERLSEEKRKLLRTNLITNGVLIPKYAKLLKKHNFSVQISLDGPEHVHNMHRKYPNGKGTFRDVLKGISACIKNKISWSIHGVCTKDTLKYFAESMLFFVKVYKLKGTEEIIRHMDKNTIQIIFEQDYTDKDVDTLIEQFYKFSDAIINDNSFTKIDRIRILDKFLTRVGASCGAGTGLMAVDEKFDIYPCHRLATVPDKKNHLLGNIYKPKEFTGYKMLNSYSRLKRDGKMYSAVINLQKGFKEPWFMWCPATNYQTTGSVYYQNAKYNLMFSEVDRAIKDLRNKYDIKDGSSEQQHHCK